MSKEYDATTKDLIETTPAGWVEYLGRKVDPSRVSVIDADVATVSAAADKVIRVDDVDGPWLLHLEFQTSHELGLPRRMLRYNALLQDRHECPVASAVLLLRKEANPSDLTGDFPVAALVGPAWAFRYTVVRVWQQPPESFLTGSLGLLPFAPIAAVPRAELPGVIEVMKARFEAEADDSDRKKLWLASRLMFGVKFDAALWEELTMGVMINWEVSSTYQDIIQRGKTLGRQEGRLEEAHRLCIKLGETKFGSPSPATVAAITRLQDAAAVESLIERILIANSWDELITTS